MSMDACSLFCPCSHNSASLPSQKYDFTALIYNNKAILSFCSCLITAKPLKLLQRKWYNWNAKLMALNDSHILCR